MRPSSIVRLVALVAVVAAFAGCASSEKLAKKSQEQLGKGDPRSAYQTALKAVQKDPYNSSALTALRASARELLEHDAMRFRSLARMDTLAAADVSLGMDDVRRQVAGYGITLEPGQELASAEHKVRQAVARGYANEAEEMVDAGQPKPACDRLETALRYDANDTALRARLDQVTRAATDRVLVLPYALETRARLDGERLSEDMLRDIASYARKNLRFTELADAAVAWEQLDRTRRKSGYQEAAFRVGEDEEATRVALPRIYGDRIESHSETWPTTLYRRVRTPLPDGSVREVWIALPMLVRIEDRWVSVSVECEVRDVDDRTLRGRHETDRSAGMRIVSTLVPLPGDPADYVLYTPDEWNADRDGCRARTKGWSDALGGLSVEDFVRAARGTRKTAVVTRASGHGEIARNGRSYRVCYGSVPAESALMDAAVEDAWREVAEALAEADRS